MSNNDMTCSEATHDQQPHRRRRPAGAELLGQPVVVIGGSAGIGFETVRKVHVEGAEINTALSGAAYDIDGGQQFIAS